MRLLIIGGTMFLGRHLVDAALDAGHEVTLFNRGRTNPDLFPEVERLTGDRTADLSALAGREWDAVVDTCAYHPRDVRSLTARLAGATGHYQLVSTVSVYADVSTPGIDEDAPVATLDDPEQAEVSNETYGALKAACEEAALAALAGITAVVRPGLIVGPHDPSDRFTYWPARIASGGEVLAPAPAAQPVQIIDARDLARWMLHLAEQRTTGVFNATGPDRVLTLGEVLDACVAAGERRASLVWTPTDFLDAHAVGPWMDLPLVVWGDGYDGFNAIDVSRALAAGLTFRPVAATVADTLAWHSTRGEHALRAGLPAEREAEVLAAWAAASR